MLDNILAARIAEKDQISSVNRVNEVVRAVLHKASRISGGMFFGIRGQAGMCRQEHRLEYVEM